MRINLRESDSCRLINRGDASELITLTGRYTLQHFLDGKLIDEESGTNTITTEGKTTLLDSFNSGTLLNPWYVGLIDITGYSTGPVAGDTYVSHGGWAEFTAYTDTNNGASAATRPEWQNNTASAGSISNTTTIDYVATGSGTVKGFFVVAGTQSQTKGDTTSGNKLWAATLFSAGDKVVSASSELKLIYTISA